MSLIHSSMKIYQKVLIPIKNRQEGSDHLKQCIIAYEIVDNYSKYHWWFIKWNYWLWLVLCLSMLSINWILKSSLEEHETVGIFIVLFGWLIFHSLKLPRIQQLNSGTESSYNTCNESITSNRTFSFKISPTQYNQSKIEFRIKSLDDPYIMLINWYFRVILTGVLKDKLEYLAVILIKLKICLKEINKFD